jgi:hypothetical protein
MEPKGKNMLTIEQMLEVQDIDENMASNVNWEDNVAERRERSEDSDSSLESDSDSDSEEGGRNGGRNNGGRNNGGGRNGGRNLQRNAGPPGR